MAESENNLSFDFIATFFVGKQMVSRMFSDVLKNKNNQLFLDMLGLPSDFTLPFSQKKEKSPAVSSDL